MGLFDRLLGGSEAKRRVEELQKRLKTSPTNVSIAVELADALAETGSGKTAVRLLNELGPVLVKKGQYMAAIAVFKKVGDLDPKGLEPGSAASRRELERLQLAQDSRTLTAPAPTGRSGRTAQEEAEAQQKREQIQPVVAQIPLFRDVPPHLIGELIEKIHLKPYPPGETLFQEGSPGSSLLFVVSGELTVTGKGEAGKEVLLSTLKAGDVAGEMSFLSSMPRSATVRTKAPSVVLEIERRAVDPLVRKSPKLKESLQKLYKERVLNDVLVRSSLFGGLSQAVRDEIAHRLVPLDLAAGEEVSSDGDNVESLFLIAQGLIRISVNEGGEDVERAILYPPSFFRIGAQGAKATTVTDVELFCLRPADLAPLLAADPRLWKALDEVQLERLSAKRTGASA